MAFIAVGVLHFLKPAPFVAIVPAWLPEHLLLVYISGSAEIAGGAGLLIPSLRRFAAYGLIALLVAVFPANLHMALDSDQFAGIPPIVLWLRLPLQPLLIWLVWRARR